MLRAMVRYQLGKPLVISEALSKFMYDVSGDCYPPAKPGTLREKEWPKSITDSSSTRQLSNVDHLDNRGPNPNGS